MIKRLGLFLFAGDYGSIGDNTEYSLTTTRQRYNRNLMKAAEQNALVFSLIVATRRGGSF